MVASLRYLDTFVKMDDSWLFAERRLYVDWLEERALSRVPTKPLLYHELRKSEETKVMKFVRYST
jgi:hypothetical protein